MDRRSVLRGVLTITAAAVPFPGIAHGLAFAERRNIGVWGIGIARMFGFRLRENFNLPYLSGSITEF